MHRAGRTLLDHHVERDAELGCGLANAQANEAERAALVEQHDQDDARAHDRDVDVGLLPFVKLAGEFLLREELGDRAGGRYVSGGQRRQRGDVDRFDLTCLRHRLAVLVDDQNRARVRVALKDFADVVDLLQLLLVHHELLDHRALAPLPPVSEHEASAWAPRRRAKTVPTPLLFVQLFDAPNSVGRYSKARPARARAIVA